MNGQNILSEMRLEMFVCQFVQRRGGDEKKQKKGPMKVITESFACEQAFGGWGVSHFFSPYPWAPNRELAAGSLVGFLIRWPVRTSSFESSVISMCH